MKPVVLCREETRYVKNFFSQNRTITTTRNNHADPLFDQNHQT